MNEAVWLASDDPESMLKYLIGTDAPRVHAVEEFPDCRTSNRKLRLFACACYYRISHLLPDLIARDAIETAERFADGAASLEAFEEATTRVMGLSDALEGRWRDSRGTELRLLSPTHESLAFAGVVTWDSAQKAAYYASSNAYIACGSLTFPYTSEGDFSYGRISAAERRAQGVLLRDIFGNPFRPVTFDPDWRTTTAVQLAQQMYDSRDFSAMPILADALQDAGCDNADDPRPLPRSRPARPRLLGRRSGAGEGVDFSLPHRHDRRPLASCRTLARSLPSRVMILSW